jgi:hypothetical protein
VLEEKDEYKRDWMSSWGKDECQKKRSARWRMRARRKERVQEQADDNYRVTSRVSG